MVFILTGILVYHALCNFSALLIRRNRINNNRILSTKRLTIFLLNFEIIRAIGNFQRKETKKIEKTKVEPVILIVNVSGSLSKRNFSGTSSARRI